MSHDAAVMREQYRLLTLPDIIAELSKRHVIVHVLVKDYQHGRILTKEELYCQVIKTMCDANDKFNDREISRIRKGAQ